MASLVIASASQGIVPSIVIRGGDLVRDIGLIVGLLVYYILFHFSGKGMMKHLFDIVQALLFLAEWGLNALGMWVPVSPRSGHIWFSGIVIGYPFTIGQAVYTVIVFLFIFLFLWLIRSGLKAFEDSLRVVIFGVTLIEIALVLLNVFALVLIVPQF